MTPDSELRLLLLHIDCARVAGGAPCSRRSKAPRHALVCQAASLQFIKGFDEPSVPDVKLTRSKDGTSGTATFVFDAPSIFESSEELGDITGLYMIDDEGELSTVDVAAKFVNGKPDRIEAKYIMRSAFEWDRFMRYMERYAEQQGLGFQKVGIAQRSRTTFLQCSRLGCQIWYPGDS